MRELGGGGGEEEEVRVDKAKVGREGLSGEWVGWRDVKKRGMYEKGEEWSEERQFEALKEDVGAFGEEGVGVGVLWLHGGEYWLTSGWERWMDMVRVRVCAG